MIVAITSTGSTLKSDLDKRFGRAQGFVLVDTETDEIKFIDNKQNLNAPQGAGIQAAQTVIDANASVVITGNCGPKAFRALSAADVTVYTADTPTVADALESFKQGKLTASDSANVDGHW